MTENTQAIDYDRKIKYQLEVIKRIDTYIGSTNTKCTIVMSYCAAALAFTFTTLINFNTSTPHLSHTVATGVIAAIEVLFALACMAISIATILPKTFSNPHTHEGSSKIFFGDIAKYKTGASEYSSKVITSSDRDFLEDLNTQTHTLSVIASDKFKKIQLIIILLLIHFAFLLALLSYIAINHLTRG